jgi:hypothetical protein
MSFMRAREMKAILAMRARGKGVKERRINEM